MSHLDIGRPGPLGVHWDGSGLNVAIWSRHAERIELCLFTDDGHRELTRLTLPGRSGEVFHGRLPDAGPGLVYGLRAHGPYEPRQGHRFNPNKLLIDPHARELIGRFRWNDAVLGYQAGHADGCFSFDTRDSAPFVPKCRVAGPIRQAGDRLPRPGRPWSETLIYEMHVRGFSRQHPGINPRLRGTIEALAEPASLAHFKRLGITAVELLPVAAWIDELHLDQRGLTNYWGYNPIAFFAMQSTLAGPGGLAAMARTVERLHGAGIEVLLDVVFNHTAEGDERGPTLSLRGLDNASYYLPDPERAGGHRNLSGCGNTLAAHHPAVSGLIIDALRFWADEVGVDGFRFDLASAIARDARGDFSTDVPWLRMIRADPVLSRCKWIAESWDSEAHVVGRFPHGWSEWNDRSRDDQRRFWRGDTGMLGALATRIAGSSDLFDRDGRTPGAGINYLTAHDGMTLADLTTFRHRRNHSNGEDNRDGSANDFSDDCGIEGRSANPPVVRRRARRMRAMLATLLLSRGVPMLRAGDEFGATQAGNNNAYCHDGPLTWLKWPSSAAHGHPGDQSALLASLARLRAWLPALRADRFFSGTPAHGHLAVPDITWLRPDGHAMQAADWHDSACHAVCAILDAGAPVPGAPHDRIWLGICAQEGLHTFLLPAIDQAWVRVLDTAADAVQLALEGPQWLVVDGPAVVMCVSGSLAARERQRWQPGLPASTVLTPHDPNACIERVLTTDSSTADTPEALLVSSLEADPARRVQHLIALDPATPTRQLEAAIVDGERRVRASMPLARTPLPALAPGSYELCLQQAGASRARERAALHVAPSRCHLPALLTRPQGAWVLSAQLYALHSADSWGIGDFDDLARLIEQAAALGAAGALVSPLHAPSLTWTDRGSPYSPSCRRALNPLFVSLPRAAADMHSPGFDAWLREPGTTDELSALRDARQVHYPRVVALKRAGFERLWADAQLPANAALLASFQSWWALHAQRLQDHARFEALAEHLDAGDWRVWPSTHAHSNAPAVLAFAQTHASQIGLHAFIQWLAARQWQAVGERAARAGAGIGPIADLAVGCDPGGADAWALQDLLADGFELGAPPDEFAREGQAWGLPPWRPQALEEEGLMPFAHLLDACMDHAGGLRIDHVMALERLFWVPRGGKPADGAYVAYPLDALLSLVAASSARHRCLVIGEDLGTVREGLRERLASAGVLSCKVAWFERTPDGQLLAPQALPALSAACASTHDLPTIEGWAAGRDIDERHDRGEFDAITAEQHRASRHRDLAGIQAGLEAQGMHGEDLTERLHRWLAGSSARLVIVQLDDVCGQHRQANLPGTPDESPNWRHRLPLALEGLPDAPRWRQLASIFASRSH